MKLKYTERFIRSLEDAHRSRRLSIKQSSFLMNDLRHQSLRAKKYDEAQDIWQARVTRDWRFKIQGDTYLLIDIVAHPK